MQREVDLITTAIEYARQEDRKRVSELEAQLAAQHERVIMLEVSYAEKPEALSDANEMLAELESQLAVEKETWRCFHCGFETADRAEAEVHFGARDDAEEFKPFCRWWASMSPEDRGETLQDTIEQLNSERDENAVLRSKIDGLEYRIHGIVSEIKSFKPFRNCESIHQVFHVYDSMEGRMLVAEEKLAERDAKLKAAREYLLNVPCACKKGCPACGQQLKALTSNCWINSRELMQPGDYECENCDDSLTRSGNKYWQAKEVVAEIKCERCKALAALDGEVR